MTFFFTHYSSNTPCPCNKYVIFRSKTIKVRGIFSQSIVDMSTVSQRWKTPLVVIWGFPDASFLRSTPYCIVAQLWALLFMHRTVYLNRYGLKKVYKTVLQTTSYIAYNCTCSGKQPFTFSSVSSTVVNFIFLRKITKNLFFNNQNNTMNLAWYYTSM